MVVCRIGLVPSTTDRSTPLFHRASLVISRAAVGDATRYGRAALGSLTDDADAFRLAQVGAVVIWGSDDAGLAQALLRNRAGLVLLVVKQKPRKDSATAKAITQVEGDGSTVRVEVMSAKAEVVGLDVIPDRKVLTVEDLRQPVSARNHSAPMLPRAKVEPRPLVPEAPMRPRRKPKPAPDTTAVGIGRQPKPKAQTAKRPTAKRGGAAKPAGD